MKQKVPELFINADVLDSELRSLRADKIEQPPADLAPRILKMVVAHQLKKMWRQTVGFGVALGGALVMVIETSIVLWSKMSQAGFGSVAGALFSDFNMVAAHSSEFIFSLLETLPVSYLMISLLSVLAALVLLKMVTEYIRFIRTHSILIR